MTIIQIAAFLRLFVYIYNAIRSFSFAMILGVIFGTLSSLFIAAPTAFLVMGRTIRETDEDVVKA